MKNNIVLIGGGGHSLVCYDVISQNQNFNLFGFVDIRSDVVLKDIGCKYLGSDDVLDELIKKRVFFLVSIKLFKEEIRGVMSPLDLDIVSAMPFNMPMYIALK